MKDEVKEMAVDMAVVKGYTLKGVGLSAFWWIEVIENVINPIVASLVGFATLFYIFSKGLNAFYEWRHKDWKHRKQEEKTLRDEYIHTRRKSDDEEL